MSLRQPSSTALASTMVLLFLLYGSSWALSYAPLGAWAWAVALGIATLKSLLILMVFMGLPRQPVANRIVVAVAVTLILILVGFVAMDAVRR